MRGKKVKILIRNLEERDIEEVVNLHKESLNEGLISSMGKTVMKLFYKEALKDVNSFGYVAKNNSKIVGAVLSTTDYLNLLKKFYDNNFFKLVIYSISYILTHLNEIVDIIKLVNTRESVKQYIIFIFTDKTIRGLGVGKKLVKVTSREFKKGGAKEFKIEIDANNTANQFYKKLNCELVKKYEFLGKERNVYKFKV